MSFKETLDELKSLKDVRPEICEKIKSHNLPVIIYGAANTAKTITNLLSSEGVKVAGYAIDEKYYKPNQIYLELPVYNFAEIKKTPEKYVFVLGFYDRDRGTRSFEFIKSQNFIHYEFLEEWFPNSISSEYILTNIEKFKETFNWLEDELSKKTVLKFFKLKITHDLKYNFEVYQPSQYFNELTNGVRTPNIGGGVRGLRRVQWRYCGTIY